MKRQFYITAKRLRARGACEGQVKVFVRTFGERKKVVLTDENFEKAVEAGLQIWWLAYKYLDFDTYTKIDGDDFSEDYELYARRYWKAIKAKMAKDTDARPSWWY